MPAWPAAFPSSASRPWMGSRKTCTLPWSPCSTPSCGRRWPTPDRFSPRPDSAPGNQTTCPSRRDIVLGKLHERHYLHRDLPALEPPDIERSDVHRLSPSVGDQLGHELAGDRTVHEAVATEPHPPDQTDHPWT